MQNRSDIRGFTLIELIIVIVILGVLAVVAAPRFLSLSTDARIAGLQGLQGQMQSTIDLAIAKARVEGLSPVASNPGAGQANFVVDFGFGSVEVDFRNLCPESEGEEGDSLTFIEFMNLSDGFEARSNNQFTGIGYELPASGFPANQGCYVRYDSFGDPECTLDLIDVDC